MIRSFKTKETESIWLGIPAKHFSTEMQIRVRRKLRMLNNVRTLQELKVPPGNRLEQLKADRKGHQYRICFSWSEGDCFEVELTDYH
jgi:proteic killer suppression protein